MQLSTAVAFALILASSVALSWAKNTNQPPGPIDGFVENLLGVFFNRLSTNSAEQRQRFERYFNENTFDVQQLIAAITIGGDIQLIVDDTETRANRLWQLVHESSQLLFWNAHQLHLAVQHKIESRIPPSAKLDPLVKSTLIEIMGLPRRLIDSIDKLVAKKRASFIADLDRMLDEVKRLHAEAVASNDPAYYQPAFERLLSRAYNLLWENFSDYYERYEARNNSTIHLYRVLALLAVSQNKA